MTDQSELPVLYSFRRCPYAMRARMGLYASGRRVALREILLRQKPSSMLAASPKGTVPVLILPDGQVIEESLDIMLWALNQHDPESWLSPPVGDLADMLDLICEMDGNFKHHLDRYKYASRYEDVNAEAERGLAMEALAPLCLRLDNHLNLFGDAISLADIALFPFVRQFANTDRAWFDRNAMAGLAGWLVRHETSDLFAAIFIKWPVWQDGDKVTVFP